jgi:hypothetical protein
MLNKRSRFSKEDALSSADKSYDRKDFAQALAAYQAALEQQPSFRREALVGIFMCHDNMGNHRCSVLLTCVYHIPLFSPSPIHHPSYCPSSVEVMMTNVCVSVCVYCKGMYRILVCLSYRGHSITLPTLAEAAAWCNTGV